LGDWDDAISRVAAAIRQQPADYGFQLRTAAGNER
jgi:hypothetical protein